MGMIYIAHPTYSKKDWVGQAKAMQKDNIDFSRLSELREIKKRREFLPSEQIEYDKLEGNQ